MSVEVCAEGTEGVASVVGSVASEVIVGYRRLRFRTPESGFELVVPADLRPAELLPVVLGYAGGAELEEKGIEHGGWVLRRADGTALDEECPLSELELRDGDELELCPRRAEFPAVHFDDMVDAVKTGVEEQGDSWRPALTHHFALGSGLLALAVGWALLALPGAHPLRLTAAAAVGVLLLFGAVSAARAVGDAVAGVALGATAVPYLALAGVLAPTGATGRAHLAAHHGMELLTGGAAGLCAALLALAAVGCDAPLFLGAVLLALVGVAGGASLLSGLSTADAALVAALVTVALAALVPWLASWLSHRNVAALRRGVPGQEAEPDDVEADLDAVNDRYRSAFRIAAALGAAACLTVLAATKGTPPHSFAAALSLLVVLHALTTDNAWQRLALLLAGAYGTALLVAHEAVRHSATVRLGLLGGLLVLGALLLPVAWRVAGRQTPALWPRVVQALRLATVVGLLALAAWAIAGG
ncbi:type VII secretion integral membrane protein EccD [Streptacidiphilus fuscans]|uniref:Type VII secretion integral membrane protein EccD n=1 Tax=Streptacidiphilus fuscans TaxID=2789292 RepID=A0A931BAH7_9ACTN|nr:type VII secretion integral membrane protein EccD [Streptacidiphilus fuscans]MBF9072577.1 type VII secretion integral membrane protein EccD [Streptacidiphilus fuscans]